MEFADRLGTVWFGVATHLWQTTLVLGAIFLLARWLRHAPARYLVALWWVALIKMLVPATLFAPLFAPLARLLRGGAVAPPAPEWFAYVTVLLDPVPAARAAGSASVAGVVGLGLTVAWLVGVGALFALRLRARRRSPRVLEIAVLEPAVRERLDAAAVLAGVAPDRLRVAPHGGMPCVTGLLRPSIVIPECQLRRLDADELRSVLQHEAAHVRRGDVWVEALARLATLALFFYPPAWWVARRLRESAEFACDAAVLAAGVSPARYADTLARAVTLALAAPPATGLAGCGRGPTLTRRLERIDQPGRYRLMTRHRMAIMAALVLACGAGLPLVSRTEPARAEPVAGDRFAVLDSLSTLDVPIEAGDATQAEDLFRIVESATGLRLDARGVVTGCSLEGPPPTTARALLKVLGATCGLYFELDGDRELAVIAPFLSGKDGVTNPRLIAESKVHPEYPEDARREHVEGKAILEAVIDRNGEIHHLLVLRSTEGYPSFGESAVEAVSRWRYEPATFDGEPVDVVFTVFIEFRLNGEARKD